MTEVKLGTKHECHACGTKFYDLGKPEIVCPSCGANQEEEAAESAESSSSGRSEEEE